MGHKFAEIAFTPSVRQAQALNGSRKSYARLEEGEDHHNRLSPREIAFIAARDSFYMATVSETGWPYIQHRGGPAGFLRVLDNTTLGFADFRGNRQYVSLGNLTGNDRVSLFLMDYANQARLKILGHARMIDRREPLVEQLVMPGYQAIVERGFIIGVEAVDWNCRQHITPRYSQADMGQLRQRIDQLEKRPGQGTEG